MTRNVSILALSLFIAWPTYALNEVLETYNAVQGLAMGNAFTADAVGVNALFYNPAGLARAENKGWSITPVALDTAFSTGYLATAGATRNVWFDRMLQTINTAPGNYNYLRGNLIPSATRRNFGIALLGTYEFAALSNGTTVDMNFRKDLGVVLGASTNLFSNMIKVGLSVKAINRAEMAGVFDPNSLTYPDPTAAHLVEGIGVGADLGVIFTLPATYLPTLAFAWKDAVIGMPFIPMKLFHGTTATGVPIAGTQSFNLGASIHPVIWKGARGTLSVELRRLERTDLDLFRKLHIGFQFVAQKRLYLWAGMSQMYPTGGVGLRMKGGDFELGSYAVDVGDVTTAISDRRFMMRYTIGF